MFLRLRQLCLVARELDPVAEDLQSAFGIEICHRDPSVAQFGLCNALLPIGNSFIEIVAPIEEGTAAERYIDRRGGDGGYMTIHDTDDLDYWESRAESLKVRIAAKLGNGDYRGLQLHPRDTGGALLEINQTGKGGPSLDGDYHPAGPDWQSSVRTEVVTTIKGAELQSDEPEALANRWADILGYPVRKDDGGFRIELDHGYLRFVQARDGRGEGLGGVDLLVPDAETVRERCRQSNIPLIDGGVLIGGMRFYLQSED